MKLKHLYFFITFILSILFFQCAIEPYATPTWLDFDYHIDFSQIEGENQIIKINNWINDSKNFIYTYREDFFWQYPSETLNLKSGICRDFAVLKLALIYKETGIKGNLYNLLMKNDCTKGHTIIEVNNKIYKGYQESFLNINEFLNIHSEYYIVQKINFDDIQFNINCQRYKK